MDLPNARFKYVVSYHVCQDVREQQYFEVDEISAVNLIELPQTKLALLVYFTLKKYGMVRIRPATQSLTYGGLWVYNYYNKSMNAGVR